MNPKKKIISGNVVNTKTFGGKVFSLNKPVNAMIETYVRYKEKNIITPKNILLDWLSEICALIAPCLIVLAIK